MKIQQIRNATVIVEYNGSRFLIDPFLGDKGTYPPLPSLRGNEKNPLDDLPVSIESIIKDTDMVIITHTHIDHWDPKAAEVLDKNLPFVVQNEDDANIVKEDGFTNVTILEKELVFEGTTLFKTPGKHFVDDVTKEVMDEYTGVTEAMGLIFSAETEKTLYLTGDTIWYEGVKETLNTYHPEIILANAGGNQLPVSEDDPESGRLLMNEKDVYKVHQTLPKATIIASHMEAVNHWCTSKEDLKQMADKHNFTKQLLVPADAESYTF